MHRYIVILLIIISQQGLADWVVPSERVTSGVTIREGQGSQTERIGILRPGERLEWVEDNGRWRAVRISQTQTGWVSKSWTRRISGTPGADAPLAARQQDELRIHYLPVGAGTCTVVECPGTNAPPMIIDCGSFGAGTRGPGDLDKEVDKYYLLLKCPVLLDQYIPNIRCEKELKITHFLMKH